MKQVMWYATLISLVLILSSLCLAVGYYDSQYNDTLRTCREFPPDSPLSVKIPSNITLTEDGPFDIDPVKGPAYFTITQKGYCFKRLSEFNYTYTLALCPHLPPSERSACFSGVRLWEWYYLGAVLDHPQTRVSEGPIVTVTEVPPASGSKVAYLPLIIIMVIAFAATYARPPKKVLREE
ncbi:MAG: hypothetical protein QF415_06100 [Candidatus Undinarchaeales archaeon]|jgi:hypothetical protein|nr:hypothetical protein [Candidatus Undinarchaeales archaeon]MDP7492475.1 hypothetical protein [Candidatus Undinarchaeales archaeon]